MSNLVVAHVPFRAAGLALAASRYGALLEDLVPDGLCQPTRATRRRNTLAMPPALK